MRTSLLLRETLSIVGIRGLDHVDDHGADDHGVHDYDVDEDEDL